MTPYKYMHHRSGNFRCMSKNIFVVCVNQKFYINFDNQYSQHIFATWFHSTVLVISHETTSFSIPAGDSWEARDIATFCSVSDKSSVFATTCLQSSVLFCSWVSQQLHSSYSPHNTCNKLFVLHNFLACLVSLKCRTDLKRPKFLWIKTFFS